MSACSYRLWNEGPSQSSVMRSLGTAVPLVGGAGGGGGKRVTNTYWAPATCLRLEETPASLGLKKKGRFGCMKIWRDKKGTEGILHVYFLS